MQFEFATATQIVFGAGTAREIGAYAPSLGQRAMVVTGRSPARADIILEQLNKQGIESISFSVPGEPTTDIALAGVQKARQAACDWVIGIGGGSVIDTGKESRSPIEWSCAVNQRSTLITTSVTSSSGA